MQSSDRVDLAARAVGWVAHDLNNLLIPLVGYPDMIRGLLPPDSPILGYVEKIQRSALSIHDLNQRLLSLSPGAPGHRQAVDLSALVGQVVGRSAIPDSIVVAVEAGSDLPPVEAASSRLSLALEHLLANAVEAMPEGGRLNVSTASIDGRAALRVADEGPGIPAELHERVFEPFFSTKDRDRGHRPGLGLTVVLMVAREHGGDVEIDCPPGGGPTVTLRLS